MHIGTRTVMYGLYGGPAVRAPEGTARCVRIRARPVRALCACPDRPEAGLNPKRGAPVGG